MGFTTRLWHRHDVALTDWWLDEDGQVYMTVAIADQPTIEILDPVTGKQQNHVIGSPNFARFKRLRPEGP